MKTDTYIKEFHVPGNLLELSSSKDDFFHREVATSLPLFGTGNHDAWQVNVFLLRGRQGLNSSRDDMKGSFFCTTDQGIQKALSLADTQTSPGSDPRQPGLISHLAGDSDSGPLDSPHPSEAGATHHPLTPWSCFAPVLTYIRNAW